MNGRDTTLAESAYAVHAREGWRAQLALRGRPCGPDGRTLERGTACGYLRGLAGQDVFPLLARRAEATLRAEAPLALPTAATPRGIPG